MVAIAPSSVYRVLPERPYEQWRTDIDYRNIYYETAGALSLSGVSPCLHDRLGTHYFFPVVPDGFSRFIVHHEMRLDMTVRDVEIVMERALERLPKEIAPTALDHRQCQPVLVWRTDSCLKHGRQESLIHI